MLESYKSKIEAYYRSADLFLAHWAEGGLNKSMQGPGSAVIKKTAAYPKHQEEEHHLS